MSGDPNGDDAANFATWPVKKSTGSAPPKAGGVKFSDAPNAVVVPVSAAATPSTPFNPKTPLLSADLKYSQEQAATSALMDGGNGTSDEPSSDNSHGVAGGVDFMNFLTPRDEHNAAYATFVLLGIGLLFPWNSVISSPDFFEILFPNQKMEFLFTITYMTTNFVGLMFVLKWGSQYSFQSRIVPGFAVYALSMLILPFIENVGGSLTVVAILGACDSVVQGSLFGLVGMFSPRYVSGFMTGQGVAGLSVALLRLFAKGVFPGDDEGIRHSGYLYFMLSVAVIVAAVAAYMFVLQRSPVTKHYLSKSRAEVRSAFSRFVTVPLGKHDARRDAKDVAALSGGNEAVNGAANDETSYMAIFRQVWLMAFTVFMIFWVTLAIFPGITSELTSVNPALNGNGAWFGIIMITLFDAGDVIGRSLPNWPALTLRNEYAIAGLSVLRVVFMPLFIAAARHDSPFHNDAYPVIIMLGFAISNGYLGTVAMMCAVDKVAAKEKEATGTFMVFALTIGLTSGVWTGYIISTVLHL